MLPRNGATVRRWQHHPLALYLSLAVNAYVLIYVMFHQRTVEKTSTAPADHLLITDYKRAQLAASQPLFGNAWPSLTGGLPEVWALGTLGANESFASDVEANLSPAEREELQALCGRCLHQTITKSVEVRGIGESVFVATGDIPDEWLRDGSVQLSVYLPRLAEHPVLRPIIEGAIRTQAYYILSDPWANSYRKDWVRPDSLGKFERQIGRGGWIATRNFEVDSGAYWLNLLWNYASTEGSLWAAASFLNSSLVHDAAALLVDTWRLEQRHEEASPYRYAELPREGKGALSNYTGMIWSGFRPSDDPNTYGFNIPVNMYAAGSLERLVELNKLVWRDPMLGIAAAKLAEDIRQGIEKFGVVPLPAEKSGSSSSPSTIYAYEVDGLGKALASFDDPNIPSLLSVPLLGYRHYDPEVYGRTRQRILSPANSHYYAGKELRGCGSPHTPHRYVWSLAHCVQGLTSEEPGERADLFRQLLKMQGGNGLMHESNDVDHPGQLTRPLFQWANTMLVVYYEQTFGRSCSPYAEALRLQGVAQREARENLLPRNGGPDLPAYYDRLEQSIPHV
ncbi:hypothetical protein VOLCADRAFT_107056 [Volvox carteri f. nagariensis]|uniref:Uncharacterized protein n=1 Tax=Volvox carteri f. nagariensis TaxID=3068 RepID=D8UBQ4_VOLCA|nr:uncharacterized protein VOLCADRAFT_107056 [Volvox carteri f. nagariensis]EFJ42804.1 hypothetical protein VOLCADRAFT_107056 [Volvox carteri f. nagariensis]|eukprot:XP_002956064.1 hypothetical protein VOLCADRAFT_107056 [Volvox carteri f. nagariensis]